MLCCIVLLFFFFFFQAEDGIRDYKVTGVQTCALPILHGGQRGALARARGDGRPARLGDGRRALLAWAHDDGGGHRLRDRVRGAAGAEAAASDAGRRRMRYSPTLVDHFLNPRNAGLMRDPDGVGEDEYVGCGDLARFFLRVQHDRAVEVRFQTYGCGPTIAAASAASELCRGRTVDDLCQLKAEEVEGALEWLPEDRKHSAEIVAGGPPGPARGPPSRAGRGG